MAFFLFRGTRNGVCEKSVCLFHITEFSNPSRGTFYCVLTPQTLQTPHAGPMIMRFWTLVITFLP